MTTFSPVQIGGDQMRWHLDVRNVCSPYIVHDFVERLSSMMANDRQTGIAVQLPAR
jgi:hypothetical protein